MQMVSPPLMDAELPPARTDPVDTTAWPRSVRDGLGGAEVTYAVRTGTRADTGFWFYRPRLWAWVAGAELVLWTWGPVPYERRMACSGLGGSFYNHVCGEVVLADVGREVVFSLRLPPEEGYQLLAQIRARIDARKMAG